MTHHPDSDGMDPRVRGVDFFGRLAASVSHEINNVMTIINEKSGLLEDLAYAAEQGCALDPARVRDIGASFARQTRRGVEILRRFNKFAHCVDEPSATFELKSVLDNLASLCERLAQLRKIELKTESLETGLNIHGDPFMVQHAVFACLDAVLDVLEPGGAATLSMRGDALDATVHVCAAPAPERALDEGRLHTARTLAACLRGRLDLTAGADALVLTLTFPRCVSASGEA